MLAGERLAIGATVTARAREGVLVRRIRGRESPEALPAEGEVEAGPPRRIEAITFVERVAGLANAARVEERATTLEEPLGAGLDARASARAEGAAERIASAKKGCDKPCPRRSFETLTGGLMNVRLFVSALVFSAALAAPLSASAADGRVVVELRNGTSVRGELVEKVPGKKVVVQLATGEVRTVDWDSIAKIEEPQAPPPSQPSSGAPATTGVGADGIVVHLDADDPRATLQRRAGTAQYVIATNRGTATAEGEAWEDVCVTPCDMRVPKNQTVRVAGDGVTPSSNFVLSRDVKLDAKTGSLGLRKGGVWLTTLGLTAALMGGLMLALESNRPSGSPEIFPSTLIYGLIGGGLVATGGGIAMIVASGTTVKDDHGTEVGRLTPPATTGKAFVLPAAFSF